MDLMSCQLTVLTPYDFLLWGWAKEEVNQTIIKARRGLENGVLTVLGNVLVNMLQADVPH